MSLHRMLVNLFTLKEIKGGFRMFTSSVIKASTGESFQ
jgi:hypothetical protein